MKVRKSVAALAAAGLVASVSACGSGSGDEQIVIGSYGGDYDRFLEQFVHPVFEEASPDTSVVFDAGDVNALITKLGAEAGGPGTYDVVNMTEKAQAQPIEDGLLEKLDTSKIPNWENIDPDLRNDYCIPHVHSPITLITNADAAEPLTEWEQFFEDDDVLQRAGIWSSWFDYVFYPAAVMHADGDPGEDWSPGYDDSTHAGELMRMYGSAEQNGQGLISGEIDYMVGPRARAAQWSQQSGGDFRTVIPESGTFTFVSTTCIPANAQNKDAAYAYLNAQLDPEAQQGFASNMFYAPSVTNAAVDPELVDLIGVTEEEMQRIYPIDWQSRLEESPVIREMWDQATS
ncbi:ABC transporter substrate-binding protein [Brevibacterium album]|uniref:ABC transporter substrate-binding protein n=1 Tax=Brevibacterium album TaxID=417948 RepID=UPI00048F4CE6|nr:extracellular solute-binding protein [Brevibacterium album]